MNISRARSQQRIAEAGEKFGALFDAGLPGVRDAGLLIDALLNGVEQIGIIEDFKVRVEDGGFAGGGNLHLIVQCGELHFRLREGVVESDTFIGRRGKRLIDGQHGVLQ